MSYDDWLTTPPPMESAEDVEDEDIEVGGEEWESCCAHGLAFDEHCEACGR